MTTYTSNQKQLFKPQGEIYAMLSNLKNIDPFITNLPSEITEKIHDIQTTEDSISFSVEMLNKVVLRIVDKEDPKYIKFGADNFPIQFNFWIQLVGVSEYDTRMKLTLKAEIPLMLRPMIGNKIEKGIETFADALTQIINR